MPAKKKYRSESPVSLVDKYLNDDARPTVKKQSVNISLNSHNYELLQKQNINLSKLVNRIVFDLLEEMGERPQDVA